MLYQKPHSDISNIWWMLNSKLSFCVITGNVCIHCTVQCLRVVSTKQSQRLQTGQRLRDRNAIITSKWKCSYDSDRKYRGEWERLSYRKLPMDQYANCGTILSKVCNFTNHEKSGKISAPVQCQAWCNLNFEEKFWYFCNFDVFCDKGMAIPQINFGFFWPLNSRFGLFLVSFLHCLAFYWNFHLEILVA